MRAGAAEAAVDGEFSSEAARAAGGVGEVGEGGAAEADRVSEHGLDGVVEASDLGGAQRSGEAAGVESGVEGDFRGVDVADAGEAVLAQEPGLEFLAAVGEEAGQAVWGAAAGERFESGGRGGTIFREEAEGAEAARVEEEEEALVEVEAGPQVPRLGWCLAVREPDETSGHPEVTQEGDAVGVVEPDGDLLAQPAHGGDGVAEGGSRVGLLEARVEEFDAEEGAAAESRGEATRDRFDLGEFGHVRRLVPAAGARVACEFVFGHAAQAVGHVAEGAVEDGAVGVAVVAVAVVGEGEHDAGEAQGAAEVFVVGSGVGRRLEVVMDRGFGRVLRAGHGVGGIASRVPRGDGWTTCFSRGATWDTLERRSLGRARLGDGGPARGAEALAAGVGLRGGVAGRTSGEGRDMGMKERARARSPAGSRGVGRKRGKGPAVNGTGGLSMRDHILDRTVYLIGRKGTTDVSVREIAREAGVNVAAVNYYFSSKELMFTQLAGRFLAGYETVMGLLRAPGVPAEKRLRDWSAEVMKYLALYPGILQLMERLMGAGPLDPFGEAMRSAMQSALRQLRDVLSEYVGPMDEDRLGFKLALFASALAGPYPSVTGRAPRPPRGLREPAARAKFLDLLLEHVRR